MKNGRHKAQPPRKFVPRQICPEFRLSEEEAETVGRELLRLGAQLDADGHPRGLPAKKIVDAAEKKGSPLHPYIFGKTDAAILRTAREDLARKLINSVRIEIVLTSGEREVQPLMVNLKPSPSERRGYISTESAQASEYMTDQKFSDAVHRLNGWLDEFRAFRHGSKLGPLWDGVRSLLEKGEALDDVQARTEKMAARRVNRPSPKCPHSQAEASPA